jgi:hypothetical protein
LISEPVVGRLTFSPDERYALVDRVELTVTAADLNPAAGSAQPPPGVLSLVLWDRRSRKSTDIWKASLKDTVIERIDWIPQTSLALIQVRQSVPIPPVKADESGRTAGNPTRTAIRQTLSRLSATTGRVEILKQTESIDKSTLDFVVSPAMPLAVLVESRRPGGEDGPPGDRVTLTLLDRNGQPKGTVPLPETSLYRGIRWSEAGLPLIRIEDAQDEAQKTAGDQPITRWLALDPRTAELRPLDQPPALMKEKPVEPATSPTIRLKPARIDVREGDTSLDLGLLWLESKDPVGGPKALVCGDCSEGKVLAGGDLVVYQSQGAAWVVPLLRMDKAAITTAYQKAKIAVVINRAKQIGLALAMHAQDWDQALPGPDEVSKLLPYLPPQDVFDFLSGLNYTYPGGKLPADVHPAQVELGWYNGPGGRALIYADGHVVWKAAGN